MRPAIKIAVDELDRATKSLRAVLGAEQAVCQHPKVIHSNWQSSDWGSAFKARRLCLDCGREEEAMYSGWGESDRDFSQLKTDGFHKVVDKHELWQERFPECDVDANTPPKIAAPTTE